MMLVMFLVAGDGDYYLNESTPIVFLQLYENLLEPGTAAWLDTVGWEDR